MSINFGNDGTGYTVQYMQTTAAYDSAKTTLYYITAYYSDAACTKLVYAPVSYTTVTGADTCNAAKMKIGTVQGSPSTLIPTNGIVQK
jgi:hypothetical protein